MIAMVRFKMKTLIALIFGVFTTLSTIMYVTTVADYYSVAFEMDKNQSIASFHNSTHSNQSEFLYIPSEFLLKEKFNESYTERQTEVMEACKKYFKKGQVLKVKRTKLDHILIDEKHKVLFCYVPKVACTNWKRILMVLTGKASNISQVINLPSYEVHARNMFPSLQNYSNADVDKMIKNYTKFVFVRNPFERLLSAYRNKLEQHYNSSKYFQSRVGRFIIKNFRKNPSNVSLEKGDDVTFSEFVSYLVSRNASSFNEHWQTVTDLCHPCFLNFDFIGKYETLAEDSSFVLNHLKLNFSFPVLPKPSKTAASLGKYFSTVDKSDIYKLYSIYEMDFKLFGYDLFDTLGWSKE